MGLSSKTIDRAAEGFSLLLKPATEPEMVAAIGMLLRHAATFNIPTDDKGLASVYRQSCASMPGDLLVHGVKSVLGGWTDSFRLPTPAMIWEFARDPYRQRQDDLRKIMTAKSALESRKPEPVAQPIPQGVIQPDSYEDAMELVRQTRQAIVTAGFSE